MSVTLMKTSTPWVGDEENRFPSHYSEAGQMARFSSTGGCRYNNGSDRITLLRMYIMILHILCHDHYRLTLHHPGQIQRCHRPLGLHVLILQRRIFCWHRLVVVSWILGSKEVGECLARCNPSRLPTRITRNPVVRGLRVLATVCNSFKGKRSIGKVYISFQKKLRREEKYR